MNIIYHGHSCFTIEEKINGNLVTVVCNPYVGKEVGLRLPKLQADIITVSHLTDDANNTKEVASIEKGGPVIFDRPGEYESKGILLNAIGGYRDKKQGEERGKTIMYNIDVLGIRVLHAGGLCTKLSDIQIEKVENVDILLIPVGGNEVLNAKEAAEVVRQVEPRIVIPMTYSLEGMKTKFDSVEAFKKEMGATPEVLSKLKIAKKDLPQDELEVVVLEKN